MNEEIRQIIEEFEMFSDWQDKYSYIIDIGKKLPKLDALQKVESNKVNVCISQVWLVYRQKGNKYYFGADSDASIVKGLLAIILRVFSGKTREQIIYNDFQELFSRLGFNNHLSPSRSNGIFAVVNKIINMVKN